ncbi:regulatory protein RecX [Prevotella sp. S7 MS 2]|uniref:regulatory protein RecX n=1 Tax=Prevotella sp. S7 MS 2 TaxID=1287488 RepID=UPI000513273D|nr:regulatory protein RecX [Prevotella sp. S7 MS 2]KGI61293.1 RecX family transcriptional regulator [Prevotella sp. S7 MS 2]
MKEMTEQQALFKLSALCSQAEHCSGEMLDKMCRWGIDEAAQTRIMAHLIEEKYVDDARYTHAFARDKIRYNGWGRRKVEQALYAKHVERAVYMPVLDEIDDQEYLNVLRPLLRNKQKSIKAASDYERNMKLIKFAMGRGFDYSLIRQCLEGDFDEPME